MMRKALLLLILLCLLGMAPLALATETEGTVLSEIGVTAAFPSGWTVVTPETVANHLKYYPDAPSAEIAADLMRAEGICAAAFSPAGDASLRVIVQTDDPNVQTYHDIERYPSALRNVVMEEFLDRDAWALTGYRYTEANWSNREGQGRMLHLAYSVKYGEETIARGRQTYTVRDGKAITLDLIVTGRQITTEDERAYTAFLEGTALPETDDAPLLPVGLTLTSTVPEETHQAAFTIRGESTKGAAVSAWLIPDDGDMFNIGRATAGNGGIFKLEVELPKEGIWRMYLMAEMEGYSNSEEALWVDYDSRRLPVTFTEYPEGEVYDSQIYISGKTISGVQIQCMEGEKNLKKTTGSDGTFSFKLDRTLLGDRKVVVSFTKKNYDNRRFDIAFTRKWTREDYVKELSKQVESLSYKNLTERPDKYLGRIVVYKGTVLDISGVEDRMYIQLGVKQDKEGRWTERIIAVAEGLDHEILLTEGDIASLYFEVTGEFYAFSDVNEEGDEIDIDLPSVKLLSYEKHI